MYAMDIQNDVIGLALRENYKSKQVTRYLSFCKICSRHDIFEILLKLALNANQSYIYQSFVMLGFLNCFDV